MPKPLLGMSGNSFGGPGIATSDHGHHSRVRNRTHHILSKSFQDLNRSPDNPRMRAIAAKTQLRLVHHECRRSSLKGPGNFPGESTHPFLLSPFVSSAVLKDSSCRCDGRM